MVQVEVYNDKSYIKGNFTTSKGINNQIHEKLRVLLGYKIPNVDFSPKYKERLWDGIISLYYKRHQSFPSGLLYRVKTFFNEEEIEYEIINKRQKPIQNLNLTCLFEEKGVELRFYQIEAVKRAMKKTRGIMSLGTGAGKTLMACELLRQINTGPFLFIVPSRELLRQTHKELCNYICNDNKPIHIGMIGDSECDINFEGINVMTYHTALSAYNEKYIVAKGSGKIVIDEFAGETIKKPTTQLESEYNQEQINYDRKYKILESSGLDEKQITQSIKKEHLSLQKSKNILNNRYASITKKDKIRKLIESCVGVLFDETHIAAIILEAIGNHAKNAYYKYGMSATAYRTDNQEIRLEGTMGRKFIDISVSDLIELQYLVPPHIYIIKMSNLIPVEYDEDGIKVKYTYQEIYNLGIIHNYKRNYTIKKISESLKENNIPTIIIIDQLEHGKILEEMIKDSVFVPGSAKKNVDDDDYEPTNEEISYRRQMLDKCERNEIILIATKWANTGINAPLIQGLVLGGSSTSPITTMQTIGRVLRKVDNKEFAIVIDFMDKDKYFHEHALQRRRIYKLEQHFFVHNI